MKTENWKLPTLIFSLAAMLLAGCHKNNEFSTHTLSDEQCYELTFDEQMGPWGTTVGQKNSYRVAWPDKGVLSKEAERELLFLCFGDSTSATIDEARQKWIGNTFFFMDENPKVRPTDTLIDNSEFGYNYNDLECTCTTDSALATFTIRCESFAAGAAHGIYSVDFLTVDLATRRAIHLDDLVSDTNLLCEAVARAIQDLDVNKDIRECLFDEYIDAKRMPMPQNFTVDSARNSITVYYSLYDITPYCCGIPEITLPIFWLSKHVALTPYAKQLFGPGCSL